MAERTYLVLGCKPWNRKTFQARLESASGRWRFASDRAELTTELLESTHPRFLFFLHWSWIVPPDIVDRWECVCFHMTDVPFGRGGSPLQNLIARGVRETKLTALRMTGELDAGPVYMKEPLSLEGGAEEIYLRADRLAAGMALKIAETEMAPQPQRGEAVHFSRRKPAQSEIPEVDSLVQLHDHIRMLDAEGYPPAFIEYRGLRFRFRRAALYDGRVEADVIITKIAEEKP